MIVDIALIDSIDPLDRRVVKLCVATLLKQGLIEPICVTSLAGPRYKIAKYNWYDSQYYYAFKELNWPTIIICCAPAA